MKNEAQMEEDAFFIARQIVILVTLVVTSLALFSH